MASNDEFRITLLENGIHSLERGFESVDGYLRKEEDEFLLKEAILFIHHGIELLLKQLLAQESRFLIFSDLRNVVKRQREANQTGTDIFSLENPPHTISYPEAIERVDAFLDVPELTHQLQRDLRELNQLRNRLEHYAIKTDKVKMVRLLSKIRVPLLRLFEAQIPKFSARAKSLIDQLERFDLIAKHVLRETSEGGSNGR
jgi:hypothetical protein